MKFKSQFTIQTEDKLMTPEAERFNGWAAMLGFVAAVGAYTFTGQIIPVFSNDNTKTNRTGKGSSRKTQW